MPLADVEVQITPDGGTVFRDAVVGVQVNLIIFDGPPKTFDEDVVAPGAFAVHADLDFAGGQHLDEVGGCELAALVRVEGLGRAVSRQCFLDSFGVDASLIFAEPAVAPNAGAM